MQIQLLYFPGCPHVEAARCAIRQALGSVQETPDVLELDVTDERTPASLRSWGSPTILVDGADVAGGEPLGRPLGPTCRLYPGSDTPGAPSQAVLKVALRRG